MELYIADSKNIWIQRAAIEFSSVIGYQSYHLEFPFVSIGNDHTSNSFVELSLREGNDGSFSCEHENDTYHYRVQANETSLKGAVLDFIKRNNKGNEVLAKQKRQPVLANPSMEFHKRGLEALFDVNFILKDEDMDFQPDVVDIHILHNTVLSHHQLIAACNFAGRFHIDCLSYTYPFYTKENLKQNLLCFHAEGETTCKMNYHNQQIILDVHGDGDNLVKLSSMICEQFSSMKTSYHIANYTKDLQDALQMNSLIGQASYLKAFQNGHMATCYCPNEVNDHLEYLTEHFKETKFHACSKNIKKYEKDYELNWEVDTFLHVFHDKVLPNIKQGDRVEIYGALSEDKKVREQLLKDMTCEVQQLGGSLQSSYLVCAYKQGYSWLEEVVLPNILHQQKDIQTIQLHVKPFLPEGIEDWGDESGAVPKRVAKLEDNPERWYDLPIRYIQELYPIDDTLASQLKLDRNQITIEKYEGDSTYEVNVFDHESNCIYKDQYQAYCNERRYLDEFPSLGLVHPSTGYIKVVINGFVLIEEKILTDMEAIWNIYQSDILPYFKHYIEATNGDVVTKAAQPFFTQMHLDICLSDPDDRLASREDIFSPLNAIHEDLYFAGLDFFKTLGLQTCGEAFDAPGLIYPIIHKRAGKPSITFTHYENLSKETSINMGEKTLKGLRLPLSIMMKELKLSDKQTMIGIFDIIGDKQYKPILKEYASLFGSELNEAIKELQGLDELYWQMDGQSYHALINNKMNDVEPLSIKDIHLYEHELIGYDQYIEVIEKLKRVPELYVYETAKSYQGRKLYAIEFARKEPGYVSRVKLINSLPVEYINARHHANEVSSTNAVFMLIKELLENNQYKDIQKKVNLVFIPFENADGAAIHYELQQEHPNWTFHIARFNAVGMEFAREYFKDETIHTEAKAFTNTWMRWLPDIVVDNHGVPSHEWEQQFSGYTSPAFKGFWLPRAILYGYYWYIDDPAYAANKQLNKKVEDAIADRMLLDEEIGSWNIDWQDRFEKYAHQWMPKLFPAEYYKNMINYWIPYKYDANHMYSSIRYPWITSCCYTSEVADETAQGDYLYLCARTHMMHDLALIDQVMKATCEYHEDLHETQGSFTARCIRSRPMIL